MRRIYLDYNATTPVDPNVLEAMLPYLQQHFGNPSSGHWFGAQARAAVERAREQVAAPTSAATLLFPKASAGLLYLAFLVAFASLAVSSLRFPGGTQPQPQSQGRFLSAIFVTSFLRWSSQSGRAVNTLVERLIEEIIKYLGKHLISFAKKRRTYSLFAISEIRARTARNSFSNSFSYSRRDGRTASFSSCSLNLPVPRQPHEHTSFTICRHCSMPASLIEYGIQYPFRSLLTRPTCLSILRCWDTAAGVIPMDSAMFVTPSGPWDFKSSMILTRVSTDIALKISEGIRSTFSAPSSIRYLSNCLNYIM